MNKFSAIYNQALDILGDENSDYNHHTSINFDFIMGGVAS